MDPVGLTVGGSWIVAGLLIAVVAWPLRAGKIGRNPLYGARIPRAFESDVAWFAINRYAARCVQLGALAMIACGIPMLWLPLAKHPGWALTLGFAPLLFLLLPAIATWRFAERGRF